MYLLYEGGLLLSTILLRDKLEAQAREEQASN
jgi:hypothetical protein